MSEAAESDGRMVNVIKNSGEGDRGFLCAVNEVICSVMRKVNDPSLSAALHHSSLSPFLPLS